MATIIPRWEWRTFGSTFGAAEQHIAGLTPTGIQESDELYLLSGAGDNVKVRGDLMDIKVFIETNPDGLEQWRPVMKAGFPLAAPDVERVLRALRLPVPPLEREAYTLDQFVAEIAPAAGTMRPVAVHKRRVRYVIGGCTAEVSDVVADGRPTRTLAIESEDAAAVIAAVRSVGLGGYLNTSYPVCRAHRRRAGAIRGHRRRDELDQVPRRRAWVRRDLAGGRGSCRADAPRRGSRGERRDLSRGVGADRDGNRGHGRGGEA
jgi:exopolyphosphatase/guanosine-5'-triphosphate,3'-diphosphate pyrophosphatase